MNNAIEVINVSKKFQKGENHNSLRDFLPNLFKSAISKNGKNCDILKDQEFWALKDVSFELKKGETLGIIGPNGSGKSTMLKLLSSILNPTNGEIKINGKLAGLIEVGAGFHPDLTGRENVYLNGTIMGMRKKEIEKHFDSIVEFSELKEFIDTPVKRYSSGMYVRLGFSVAAHMEPEILLIDEVLAVGDISFQAKCAEKIYDMKKNGTTIIFISHNMEAVLDLCPRALLLYKGAMIADGVSEDTVREYRKGVAQKLRMQSGCNDTSKLITIKSVVFCDKGENEKLAFRTGETIVVKITLEAFQKVPNPVLGLAFYNERGICLYGHNSKVDKYDLGDIKGSFHVAIDYPDLRFQTGTYFVTVGIFDSTGLQRYEYNDKQYSFSVNGEKGEIGVINIPHAWTK